MRIINDPKLDFDNCLVVPKRSVLSFRRDVELEREYTFGDLINLGGTL